MWKMQVEKESKDVGLEDAMNRARWRVGIGEIDVSLGKINCPLNGNFYLRNRQMCFLIPLLSKSLITERPTVLYCTGR